MMTLLLPARSTLTLELHGLIDDARDIGGRSTHVHALWAGLRWSEDTLAKVVERYRRWIKDSPREVCPACGGSGMRYYVDLSARVGGAWKWHQRSPLTCTACDDGSTWDRGRGWIDQGADV